MNKIKATMIIIGLVIGGLMVPEVNLSEEVNTNETYELIQIAISKGATGIEEQDGSVSFWLDNSHITYHSMEFGIRELSRK